MSYNYDRTKTAALHDGPVGRTLMKYWNKIHDLEYDLEKAKHEYDIAASYNGAGTKDARAVMDAMDSCADLLSRLADSGGAFDKLSRLEADFVKKYGKPDDYADAQSKAMFPR